MTSEAIQEIVKKILIDNNCRLISFEPNRVVKYVCSCKNNTSTNTQAIRKPTWRGCVKCLNKKRGNFNTFEFVKDIFEKEGIILPIQEYKGNKVKLHYICSFCKEEAHMSLNEFRRGRRCENCSKERAQIKSKITNLINYGVENVMHHKETVDRKNKNAYNSYEYTFPSGKIIKLQGYENICLDLLLKEYKEEEIADDSEIPVINYINPLTNKKSKYYSDFY